MIIPEIGVNKMFVEFIGYFDVDDGLEESAKKNIESVLFDLPFFIDIEFE